MIPISYIANSSRVSSDSDHPLPLDSILIKWRPVSAVLGIGSWESSHMILNIPGGVFVSWLVSLSSEAIMGFIVQGQCVSLTPLLSFPHHLLPLPSCFQTPSPPPLSSLSSNTPPLLLEDYPLLLPVIALCPTLTLRSQSPSLTT
jgi:hypothetical protein